MPTDTSKPTQIQVTLEDAGPRLDVFLARQFPDRSRTFFHDAIKAGQVTINAKRGQSSDRTRTGDTINIAWPDEKQFELTAESMDLDILHEDDDILVISKPAGLVVHPAKGNWTGTLVQGLLAHAGEEMAEMLDEEMRPGIVHRLDKDTSGVLVIAKNLRTLSALQKMFQEHTVEKTYLTLTAGKFTGLSGELRTQIGRHPRERKRMAVVPADEGKPAITKYRVLSSAEKASLVEVQILTGRTHQIRVHFAHIKHPVLGDSVYGGRQAGIPGPRPQRQMLHAWKLAFTHPGTGAKVAFTAPIPEDFRQSAVGLGLTLP